MADKKLQLTERSGCRISRYIRYATTSKDASLNITILCNIELKGTLHLNVGLILGKSSESSVKTEMTIAAVSSPGGRKLDQSESRAHVLLNSESKVALIGANRPDRSYNWPKSQAINVLVTFISAISAWDMAVRSHPFATPLCLEKILNLT